jgi:hypothetical protein
MYNIYMEAIMNKANDAQDPELVEDEDDESESVEEVELAEYDHSQFDLDEEWKDGVEDDE